MTAATPNRIEQLGQHTGLLDKTDATKFSADALAAPLQFVTNFASAIQADDAAKEAGDVTAAVDEKETLTTPVEIEKRAHHLAKVARELGYELLVGIDEHSAPTIRLQQLPKAPAA